MDPRKHPFKVAFYLTPGLGHTLYFAEVLDVKFPNFDEQINGEIRRLSALMIDLNNERLEELNRQQIEAKRKEKIEIRKKNIQDVVSNNFLQLLQASKTDEDLKVPTVVMITGGVKSERDETVAWTKKQIDSRVVQVDLGEDEDDALYRIETEIDYANDYYEKNRTRSVLFVNNFDRILNSKNVSPRTIGDLKEILADISTNNAPLTIVFQTSNAQNIDNAFLSNKIRIPCIIDLDEIKNPTAD